MIPLRYTTCLFLLCCSMFLGELHTPALAAGQAQLPLTPTHGGVSQPTPPQHSSPAANQDQSNAGQILRALTQPNTANPATAQQNQEQLARIMSIEGDPLAPLFQEGPQEAAPTPLSMQPPVMPSQPVPSPPPAAIQAQPSQPQAPAITVIVKPYNMIHITCPYAGKIRKVLVKDGDVVAKGQDLMEMEESTLQTELEAAQSALTALSSQLAEQAPSTPLEQKFVAEQIQAAADEVASIEDKIAHARIKAPFAGRVTEIIANPSQFYPIDAPLLEIAEDGLLTLECTAPSQYMRWLAAGTKLQIYITETGQQYSAVVRRLGGKINPETKTIKVYASFIHEPKNLLPGMSGFAKITASAPNQ